MRNRKVKKVIVALILFIACFVVTGCELGHTWEVKSKTEASCLETGLIEYECSDCGDKKSEPISALGHDWEILKMQDATCNESGFANYECKRCDETETEKFNALGHDWIAATCTETKVCERCKKRIGKALGHDWKKATCEDPSGCRRCSKTKGEALGHSYFEKYYGLILSCMNCGNVHIINEEDFCVANSKLENEWSDVIVSALSTIGLQGIEVSVVGYEEYPATFVYYTVSCTNLSDFKGHEMYDSVFQTLEDFSEDFIYYRLINIICENDVYMLDDDHDKLIKNGEYCYDPYTDDDRPKYAEVPYVGMDSEYLKETELGPYDDCEIFGENNPRPLFVYIWKNAGKRFFEAHVISGEVTSIGYLEDGRWVTDYGDKKVK